MTSKPVSKKYGFTLDEEKDVFLASLNKKIRNARKKIEAIDDLAKRDKATLKAEQMEKINSRTEVLDSIKAQESLKDLYYSAFKTAKEEGRWQPGAAEAAAARKRTEEEGKAPEPESEQQTQPQAPAQPQVQGQSEEERLAERAQIARESLSRVLNLVHFAQFFHDQSRVQQWRQSQGSGQNAPDFEALNEFYTKVLSFSEADKLNKVGDKLTSSLEELVAYVNGTEEPAVRNRTYRSLQEAVENVVGSSNFQNQSADVKPPQRAAPSSEPSAIGSELRRGQEHHQEAPAHQQQQTLRSPEKGTHTEAARPAEKKDDKGQKQDWTAIQDDEEEEENVDTLREEHQQERDYEGEGGRAVEEHEKPYTTLRDRQEEEEQKQANTVDEWSTVKAKTKPKKEETQGGYRGGRGGRGGYRGGEGRGGRGGYRGGEGRGGYRGGEGRGPRPDRDQQEGQEVQEGQEATGNQQAGDNAGEGEQRGGRGGYRGGYRGGRGGYRGGEGNEGGEGGRGGYRGGRGGYRGGEGNEGGEGGYGGYRGGRGGYRGGEGNEGGEGGRGGYRGGRGGYRGGDGEGRGGYRGGRGGYRGGQNFERRQENEGGARPATTTEGQTNTQ